MKNNLKFFRDAADLHMSDVSKLLNIRVDRYRQYESGTMIMPDALLIMVAKMYNIPISFLFCNRADINGNSIEYLNDISKLDHNRKIPMLAKNLAGTASPKLTYCQIAKIIKGLEETLSNLSMYL